MNKIKNIIFDLGGIFLNLDFKKTEQAFIDLGINDFSELFSFSHSEPLFENLEVGKISLQEFYDGFRLLAHLNLSDKEIETAWNAMLLDFPEERLNWLETIKQKYNVFLFSNTNQIHLDRFEEIYFHQFKKNNFRNYFIKAYFSNEVGFKKPNKESYLKILEEQNLIATETLFIDDTLKNIVGAQEAGLQTIHLAAPTTVLELNL